MKGTRRWLILGVGITAPVFGWIIGASSYGVALLVCALLPAAGALLTPVRATIDDVRRGGRARVRGKD